MDGLTQVRGGVVHRLLHAGDEPVVVRIAQLSADRVLFGARAGSRDLAAVGDRADAVWRSGSTRTCARSTSASASTR